MLLALPTLLQGMAGGVLILQPVHHCERVR